MNIKLALSTLAMILILSSCSSLHDSNSDGPNYLGGGYKVKADADGKITIIATTNFAPWENYSGARSVWEKQAKNACGNSGYIEEDVEEYSYETAPPLFFLKYIVTVKKGVAVCLDAASSKSLKSGS